MNNTDKKQAEKHFQQLVELVGNANFSTCNIIPHTDPNQVEVSQLGVDRNPSVIFVPTSEFMEDESDQFNNIVMEGILIAKEILQNPPSPNLGLQGQIHLGHKGPDFQKRTH